MEKNRIQLLIPTCNSLDDIETTMQSVWEQDYDREYVYVTIMDFGSKDGTYEKILSFPKYHLGIYRKDNISNPKIMPAMMARAAGYAYPGGSYFFFMVLYPGDVLYKNCLTRCSEALISNWDKNPSMVICEVDQNQGGRILSQSPLFKKDCLIDGYHDMKQYVSRGYRHQVQCMGMGLNVASYFVCGERNERRWWNKCADSNLERFAVYIKEPLGCQKSIAYENELEDILLRWEMLIGRCRVYKNRFGKVFDEDFERLGKITLAEYAIWRSYLLSQKGPDFQKDAEDCFLISGVIDPGMKGRELYKAAERHLFQRDAAAGGELEAYFEQNGMN